MPGLPIPFLHRRYQPVAARDAWLTEPGVRAILARLQDPAQLNAEIAQIAAAVTAADEAASLVPIPAAQIHDFVPPPSMLTALPAIGIDHWGTQLEDDIGSSTAGRHIFGAVIYCSDPDQHLLAWQLRRYAQAVARVLLAGRSLPISSAVGAAAWGTGLDHVDWGPTLNAPERPGTWLSWCSVAIWTRRDELG